MASNAENVSISWRHHDPGNEHPCCHKWRVRAKWRTFVHNEGRKFENLQIALINSAWLTQWGRVRHICVGKLTIIDSDNSLSPGRRQAIIWTNAGILLIRTPWTNFSEISSEIHTFSFKKIHSKMSSAKWRPFCLGLNELIQSRRKVTTVQYTLYT